MANVESLLYCKFTFRSLNFVMLNLRKDSQLTKLVFKLESHLESINFKVPMEPKHLLVFKLLHHKFLAFYMLSMPHLSNYKDSIQTLQQFVLVKKSTCASISKDGDNFDRAMSNSKARFVNIPEQAQAIWSTKSCKMRMFDILALHPTPRTPQVHPIDYFIHPKLQWLKVNIISQSGNNQRGSH